MLRWLSKLLQPKPDEIEIKLKNIFSFLIDDYGFTFIKKNLGNAIDKDGKFFFYGPLNAYYIYNENVCINILYLVQREDYSIFITDSYKNDQVYIRNGIRVSDKFVYDLDNFALEIENSVTSNNTIFGKKI